MTNISRDSGNDEASIEMLYDNVNIIALGLTGTHLNLVVEKLLRKLEVTEIFTSFSIARENFTVPDTLVKRSHSIITLNYRSTNNVRNGEFVDVGPLMKYGGKMFYDIEGTRFLEPVLFENYKSIRWCSIDCPVNGGWILENHYEGFCGQINRDRYIPFNLDPTIKPIKRGYREFRAAVNIWANRDIGKYEADVHTKAGIPDFSDRPTLGKRTCRHSVKQILKFKHLQLKNSTLSTLNRVRWVPPFLTV